MKKNSGARRLIALLLAALLCAVCALPAFAAEGEEDDISAVGEEPVGTEDGEEGGFSDEIETFFDRLEAGNGIGTTLFWFGFCLASAGVIGIVLLIVVSRVSAHRRNRIDEREELLEEIEEAEQRGQTYRPAPRRPASASREVRSRRVDPYADTGDIPFEEAAEEQPLRPVTPAALQPERPVRPVSVQTPAVHTPPRRPIMAPVYPDDDLEMEDISSNSTPRHAAPAGTPPRAVQHPVEKPVVEQSPEPTAAAPTEPEKATTPPAAAPKPEAAQPAPAAPHKFDLDDILREVREDRQ